MDFQFDLQRFTGTSYADLSPAEKRLLDRFRDFRIAFESISEDRYVRQSSFAVMSTAVANLNDDVALISGNLNSEVTLRAAQYTSLNSGLTNLANDVSGLSSALSMISGGFSGDLTQISTEIVSLQNDVETLNSALAAKVDTVSGKQLSTEDFTTAYKNQLDGLSTALAAKADVTALANKVNNATFATLQTAVTNVQSDVTNLQGDLDDLDAIVDGKVDKDGSKVLSTNDFTDAYKTKLDGLSSYTFGNGFEIDNGTINCTVQGGAGTLDTVELTVEGGMWLVV